MSDDILPLASEFPPSNAAHWRKLTEAALKGADFDKRLVKQTYDGLRIEPLYPRAKGAKPVAGRPAQPWQVMARVDRIAEEVERRVPLHRLRRAGAALRRPALAR